MYYNLPRRYQNLAQSLDGQFIVTTASALPAKKPRYLSLKDKSVPFYFIQKDPDSGRRKATPIPFEE